MVRVPTTDLASMSRAQLQDQLLDCKREIDRALLDSTKDRWVERLCALQLELEKR